MEFEIKNSVLNAKIISFGAELVSVLNISKNIEFMWQGDPKYWKETSPVVFPFFGRLYQNKYTFEGKTFDMFIHGFAKRREFSLLKQKQDEISLILSSDEETKQIYPFDFDLIVTYKLVGEHLEYSEEVINKGNKNMIYACGMHPGFNVPIAGIGKFDDYYLLMNKTRYNQRNFSNDGLSIEKENTIELVDNKIRIRKEKFSCNSLFMTDENDVVILKSDLNNNFIKVTFNDFKVLGIWPADQTDAPYICIEPINGFSGREGILEDLTTKKETTTLKPNESKTSLIDIQFHLE